MTEPLVVLPVSEVKRLVAEAVSEVLGMRSDEPERPLTVREFGKIYGVDSKRVYEWVEDGMPHIRTGDQRGLRIWPDQGRAWLEAHRG